MTTSLEAICHLFVFFSGIEDDDEPLNSSSSLGIFLGAKDNDEPPNSSLSLGFFLQM
jgi:hypothetical protein